MSSGTRGIRKGQGGEGKFNGLSHQGQVVKVKKCEKGEDSRSTWVLRPGLSSPFKSHDLVLPGSHTSGPKNRSTIIKGVTLTVIL